ncbi:MAG TPA: YggT family protein [Pyrinomonadaceae bacterium]|nr:YggT family protein [Pyrinomonadaceae bacterium]
MQDDKLAADEARRIAQHEALKAGVEGDVNAEIAGRAERTTRPEAARMEEVAGEFRGKAINEVIETEREVERGRGAARISQVVDYIFYVIYALLAIRFLLALLDANSRAGFVKFINTISDPFYAPFKGIVADPTADGGARFALSMLLAIVVYAVLHMGINGLLRLIAHRKTEI